MGTDRNRSLIGGRHYLALAEMTGRTAARPGFLAADEDAGRRGLGLMLE
jgi:hypothetical protein